MNLVFSSVRSAVRHLARAWLIVFLPLALAGCFGGSDDEAAPSIGTHPQSVSIAEGQTTGFTVAATGSDPLRYQWRKNGIVIDGATGTSYTTEAAALADNGALYSVVVSNDAGSATSNAATLTVGAAVAPTIATPPAAQSVIAAQTASFGVVVDGTTPLAYQWTKNGAAIPAATSATFTTAATTPEDDGAVYAVIVTNIAGRATSAAATLTVTASAVAPVVTAQPTNALVNTGQTATFGVVVAGTAPIAYQWSRNGTAIGGATGASYSTPVTGDADNGAVFRVVATNAAGSVSSTDATLTVTPLPIVPAITSQPASVSVTAGQAASFRVTATGTAPLGFQWRRDGSPIAGATAATYTLATTSATDSGALFTVVVTNAAGSATSDPATLTVGAASIAPSITSQPAAATVTEPGTATFSVVATGSAPLAYQWRRNGTPITGATAASYTTPPTSVAADNGATFSVVVGNGTLPNATSTGAVLTVRATPVAPTISTQPASTTVTVGSTATFSVVANGSAPLAYQWRRNGTPIAGATSPSYTTPATAAGDNGALFGVVVGNGTAPDAISSDAVLTVNSVWTGIRQDGAPFPTAATQLAFDAAKAVATDAQGNVIIGGITTGSFVASGTSTGYKPFIAKYSPAGVLLWARLVLDGVNAFGVTEAVNGLGVDSAGNIVVTGQTLTTLAGEVAAGGLDVFVARFDANGNRLWAHQFGSTSDDTPNALAVDASGNAFIAGTSSGQLPLQPPQAGTTNYFIAKFASDGTRAWIVEDDFNAAHPGPYNEAHGIAVDAAGNAYLAGWMTASQSGGSGAYLAKFNASGVRQWETQLAPAAVNGTLPVRADAIAVAADGSTIYLSGWTYADFDTAGTPPVAANCCLTGDAFVARFNGAGTLQWVHNLSSLTLSGPRTFDDEAFGIATDAAGSKVFITGYTTGVMPGETSKGAEDVFVARYEADGTRTWVRQFGSSTPATTGGALNDRAFGIALDPGGDLFVAGVTHGSFGTPLKNTDRDDWFVMKLRPADGVAY